MNRRESSIGGNFKSGGRALDPDQLQLLVNVDFSMTLHMEILRDPRSANRRTQVRLDTPRARAAGMEVAMRLWYRELREGIAI